jgi:hypothetical protein
MSTHLALQFLGFVVDRDYVVHFDGQERIQWLSASPRPTDAEIGAATLPAAKAARLEQDRQECKARIFERWPLQEQVTALTGNYEPGGLDSLANWQAANIAASNAARDQINLPATDSVAKVEAVTVAWPAWNG